MRESGQSSDSSSHSCDSPQLLTNNSNNNDIININNTTTNANTNANTNNNNINNGGPERDIFPSPYLLMSPAFSLRKLPSFSNIDNNVPTPQLLESPIYAP